MEVSAVDGEKIEGGEPYKGGGREEVKVSAVGEGEVPEPGQQQPQHGDEVSGQVKMVGGVSPQMGVTVGVAVAGRLTSSGLSGTALLDQAVHHALVKYSIVPKRGLLIS